MTIIEQPTYDAAWPEVAGMPLPPVLGHLSGYHVTNDGLDIVLHFTCTLPGGRTRDVAVCIKPDDARNIGTCLDGEVEQMSAGPSAIDDHDRWLEEHGDERDDTFGEP